MMENILNYLKKDFWREQGLLDKGARILGGRIFGQKNKDVFLLNENLSCPLPVGSGASGESGQNDGGQCGGRA
jgi:hypothetical protein